MDVEPSMASIGALIGSPARAAILAILFDGRALTATELAQAANVSAPTTSEHLSKLVTGGLIVCEKHGRHRYYKIAGSEVAEALEPLVHLVRDRPVPARSMSPETKAIRKARLCYDHIAGHLGVLITSALVDRGYLVPTEHNYDLSDAGEAFFTDLGIDIPETKSKRRLFAPQCLDWSERKPHFAGALGAAFTDHAFKLNWIKRAKRRRIIEVTPKGRQAFSEILDLKL